WACECDARGRLGLEARAYPQRARLAAALKATQAVDLAAVSAAALAAGKSGPAIGRAVQDARLRALHALASPG
ncbi:MAG: multifunctional CCA tRNA nucleotidyl transferase/2'3'-cyclic phosphodiesterase/2'nucleotidase/phosphatase, partial [Burkholderiaceae bacterium]